MVDSKRMCRNSGSVLLILISGLLFFSHGGDARALRFTFKPSSEIAEVIHRRLQTSSPYCIAVPTANTSALQTALNWACDPNGGKVDCSQIQQGGSCYDPDSVVSHASYAFDSYYVNQGGASQSCNFNGVASPSSTNPSSGTCVYPSLSGTGTTPSSNSTTPTTPTTSPPPPSSFYNSTTPISPTATDANSSGGNSPMVSLHWIAMLAPFALFW